MDEIYLDVFIRVSLLFSIVFCLGWFCFLMIRQGKSLARLSRQSDEGKEDVKKELGAQRERISVLEARLQERGAKTGDFVYEEAAAFLNLPHTSKEHQTPAPLPGHFTIYSQPKKKRPGRKPGSKNKPKEIPAPQQAPIQQ